MSVYAMKDPRDGRVRYVGRAAKPQMRFRQHSSRAHSAPLRCWIDELRAAGMAPEFVLLDGATEREWIVRLAPDLNIMRGDDSDSSDPGLGFHYSVNVTAEDKALIDRASAADDEPKASRWIRKVALRAARELLAAAEPVPKKKGGR